MKTALRHLSSCIFVFLFALLVPSVSSAQSTDPTAIPGSTHFAATLAYGDFTLKSNGQVIHCDGIQGISGVYTSTEVVSLPDGKPKVSLTRILTHFHFPDPSIVIEQNPSKESTGFLIGNTAGGAGSLLPGRASFSQYIILSLNGRPLANRDPLVMTAAQVNAWPPIGSSFISEKPVDFYDLDRLADPNAPAIATLSSCNAVTAEEIILPTSPPQQPAAAGKGLR
jgi:hypothetical protein